MLRGCRHTRGQAQLREALGLYETLQAMTEDIHGTRNANNALALRSIADVHSLLAQHGALAGGPPPLHPHSALEVCPHTQRRAFEGPKHASMHDDLPAVWGAGEAAALNEKAASVAAAVHGTSHPVMESYWRAVSESRHQVSVSE
jgi:hypothetical protein